MEFFFDTDGKAVSHGVALRVVWLNWGLRGVSYAGQPQIDTLLHGQLISENTPPFAGTLLSIRQSSSESYCLRRSQRSPLLEALPAKHRAPLRRPEGNGRFLAALRTGRLRFRPHLPAVAAATAAFRSLCFAAFTSLRFVLETFVREKHLFPGRKYKLAAALRTLQNPVMKFHLWLPP
ncbi:MAG TPA: hypothetical protein VKP58_08760 [Candidatus Acidoferrum sp.]|nr:hypothetical protein [Candidatus Acidoferrum sp.]